MESIGKLKTAALLIQGQLLLTILYGIKRFLNLQDNFYMKLEDIYKKCLEIILSLPESTNLEAMINLVDNGQPPHRNMGGCPQTEVL